MSLFQAGRSRVPAPAIARTSRRRADPRGYVSHRNLHADGQGGAEAFERGASRTHRTWVERERAGVPTLPGTGYRTERRSPAHQRIIATRQRVRFARWSNQGSTDSSGPGKRCRSIELPPSAQLRHAGDSKNVRLGPQHRDATIEGPLFSNAG